MGDQQKLNLGLDFVVYLGDPDDGVGSIPSAQAVSEFEQHRETLNFSEGVYGAISLTKDGSEVLDVYPDLILKLITSLIRTLPYLIDGEPETALLSESEHGFLFEPSTDKITISMFQGHDAFDPEEYLIEGVTMKLDDFGSQLLKMGERLVEMLKMSDPGSLDEGEYGEGLMQFLDLGRGAFRSYRLETERGLRH